ncbi:MAG TPA: hypothetical protein VMZ92_14375 [Planctomycetota bacterium]|nr:hypothetical protein [Planctomycetota bacterium]
MRKPSTLMLLVLLLAGAAREAPGSMHAARRFVLDFTKPETVKKQAVWSPVDRLDMTDAGLGWDGAANASYDAWIQTTEPIGIGWSWRPVQNARVSAEIIPAGEFTFTGEHGVAFPSGTLYVRHSPDTKHWSGWQVLEFETPRDKENPKQRYHGDLRIPYRERGAYGGLVRHYGTMDVPWKSDEEAAVRWIVKNDPKFFEKHTPFIGYLQFLLEISLRGSRRIQRITFDVSYGAGGRHSPPRDPEADKDRQGPWRFKAEDVPEPKTEKEAEGGKRERLDEATRAVLRRDAQEAFWAGEYAKMIAPSERLARAEAPTLDDLLWHGHAYQLSGDWPRAVAAYREALHGIRDRSDALGGNRRQNWAKLVKVIIRLERDQLKDAASAAATLEWAVKELEASDSKVDHLQLEMLNMLAEMQIDGGNARGAIDTWARLRAAAATLERVDPQRYIKIDREAQALSMLPPGKAPSAFPRIITLTPGKPDATLMLHEPRTRERSYLPKGPGNPYWRYAFAPPPGTEFETLRFQADIEQFIHGRGGHFRCFVQTEDASPGRRQLGSIHWPNDKELGRDLMGTLVEVPPGVRCVHIQTRSWEDSFNVYSVEVSATFRPATHNPPPVRADAFVQTEFLPPGGEMTCADRKLVSGRAYSPFLPGDYHLRYEVPGYERTFETDLTVVPAGRHFIFVNLDSPFRWTQARPADLAERTPARASVQPLPGGECLAVWCGEGERIMTCRTRDLVTWTDPEAPPFDNIFQSAAPATFADADGAVWLAWFSRRTSFLEETGGGYTLYLASTRDGKTWTTPRPVAVGILRTGGPRTVQMLRGPKGKHWIFYGEHAGCAPSIRDITKLTPITLEKEKNPYLADQHVSVDETGRFHMVFSHHQRGILHTTSDDGRRWSAPTLLVEQTEEHQRLEHPQLVLRGEKAVLLYETIGAYMTPVQFGGRPLKPWEAMKITGNVVPLMGARLTLTRDGEVLLLAGRTRTWLLRAKLNDLLGI